MLIAGGGPLRLGAGSVTRAALGVKLNDLATRDVLRASGSILMIPTGGYGMNAGVGDAADLGWKLAAMLEAWRGDRLLSGYTLLRFADADADAFDSAASERGVPLQVVDIRGEEARRLYERALVFVRPDQHVAWRGDAVPTDALAIIDRIRGA